jgi:hypothetical protein
MVAEGEELGSNLLRVLHRRSASSATLAGLVPRAARPKGRWIAQSWPSSALAGAG